MKPAKRIHFPPASFVLIINQPEIERIQLIHLQQLNWQLLSVLYIPIKNLSACRHDPVSKIKNTS